MKAFCPKNIEHETFFAKATVREEWVVDAHGNFLKEGAHVDVITDPDPEDGWECALCGASAQFEEPIYQEDRDGR